MHVFFSGIGGTAIGPLALIAKQAGYTVSGSDKQDSKYIEYLRSKGINDIHIGQSQEQLDKVHNKHPIDWFVYSSAVSIENPDAPELLYCEEQHIKTSKRDELINLILSEKNLKLIAIAGTHGKTTTTAMVVWLFKQLSLPVSYSVGAKISFGDMGEFATASKYFVYECDEFDRNFLAFEPHLSLITGVSWDHHEIFPTREDYQQAFKEFISQSGNTLIWQEDFSYLNLPRDNNLLILDAAEVSQQTIKLAGLYNRLDAWLAVKALHKLTNEPIEKLVALINKFPGLQRRMEQIISNLYTDYAHTPEKILGAMSAAQEIAAENNQKLVVVYEPLTNRRMHFTKEQHSDVFRGANKIYWVPSYLAREDPNQPVLRPEELIPYLSNSSIAEPKQLDQDFAQTIRGHLDRGDMVVCMSGGGGGSLDEWLRKTFI